MEQEMTMEEIEEQFKDEWVLVGDPELDEYLEVVRGRVLCHSADRDEFDRAVREADTLDIKQVAYLYTGEIPQGMAILL